MPTGNDRGIVDSWRGDAEHMADEASTNESFARRGNGNPGLRTLDSLYYDYAHNSE